MSAATTSSHLGKLVDAGLLAVEANGRHRCYRLAGPDVGGLIETLQQHAPATPVRPLQEDTRARALRRARTCYDHLAGQAGVALMAALLHWGYVTGGDGTFHPETARHDGRVGHGRLYIPLASLGLYFIGPGCGGAAARSVT